jgi:hypothetical protein
MTKDDLNAEADDMTKLLLLLAAVTKPLSLSLDSSIVPQIGEEKGLEAQRALTMTIAGLMLDVVRTTWLCAKNGAYRQLQVLDRQAFELSTRSAFYADNADVADKHWRSTNKHFIRVARKMHGDGTPDFLAFENSVLTDDAGFSSGTNAQTSNKPNFEDMCKNVYGDERGVLYYAGHYSVPSAVAHGSPAAFACVFEQVDKGYRLRTSPGMVNVPFALKAISQSGINAAASIAYLFRAPVVAKGVVLCEQFYDSFGFDKHLLLKRNFAI